MPTDIGALRQRVRLEKRSHSPNTFGEEEIAYTPVDTVWCRVAQTRGREFATADHVASETSVRIRIRYRNDVAPDWRAVVEGDPERTYDIRAVLDPSGRREELDLLCREVT